MTFAICKSVTVTKTISSVDIMKKKLDSENLGIILLNEFMEEFFQKEECSTPDMFTLVHYNGLPQSNISSQVKRQSLILYPKYLCAFCTRKGMSHYISNSRTNL